MNLGHSNMQLRDDDYLFVETFVKSNHPDLSADDLKELIGEAIVWLAETEMEELDPAALSKILVHLSEFRKKYQSQKRDILSESSREVAVGNLGGQLGRIGTDEERLEYISHRARGTSRSDKEEFERIFGLTDKDERERQQEVVDYKLRQWSDLLPLAEAEVLELKRDATYSPRWTAGIGRVGVKMLFRRACIRMLWRDI